MNSQQYSPTNFKVLPTVVKNLLIINGLFYLATIAFETSLGIDLTKILGLHSIYSEDFRPYQIVTHMFMHGGFGHLFFNMFALWMFGNLLENVWGPKKFLTYYFITGIGAAILHSAIVGYESRQLAEAAQVFYSSPTSTGFYNFLNNYFPNALSDPKISDFISQWNLHPFDSGSSAEAVGFVKEAVRSVINVPTVGASGAVFGILLAFGMLFPNSLIYIYFLFPIKAKWFVILYGAAELFLGFSNRPGDNVAHFAHLGGMIFGFLLIKWWNKRDREKQFYI